MNTINARRTSIALTYEGKDISQDISPYLLSFSFTDNSGGKADDLTITLEDSAGLWLNNWAPSKGDTLRASIISQDFPSTQSLPCGSFTIDQIDYSYPPAVLSIKAVSASVKKSITAAKHSRSWENITLRDIASDLAAQNNLALFMSSADTHTLERIDQSEQSDLEFLKALCADYGLECKIQEGRIVIYDLEEYESSSPILTISLSDDKLTSCRFTSKSAKVYRKAKVVYHNAVKDEDYEGEYEDDDEEGCERELVIHERVESQGHAQEVAKQRLIDANRQEVTGSLGLVGDVRLCAGVTIELQDFGMFSGKHFITKAAHKIDRSGYTVTIELGMPKSEKKAAKSRKKKAQSKSSGSTQLYYEGDEHY